jgi:hypothetical protein
LFGNDKKIVRKIESIGYVALFAAVGWNIIYEITKGTIDGGTIFNLEGSNCNTIWIYLGHLSNYQGPDLANQYNSLNLHLMNLSNGERYAREQYELARKIQWFLTIVATSFTAVGKIHDVIYKDKAEKVGSK